MRPNMVRTLFWGLFCHYRTLDNDSLLYSFEQNIVKMSKIKSQPDWIWSKRRRYMHRWFPFEFYVVR